MQLLNKWRRTVDVVFETCIWDPSLRRVHRRGSAPAWDEYVAWCTNSVRIQPPSGPSATCLRQAVCGLPCRFAQRRSWSPHVVSMRPLPPADVACMRMCWVATLLGRALSMRCGWLFRRPQAYQCTERVAPDRCLGGAAFSAGGRPCGGAPGRSRTRSTRVRHGFSSRRLWANETCQDRAELQTISGVCGSVHWRGARNPVAGPCC